MFLKTFQGNLRLLEMFRSLKLLVSREGLKPQISEVKRLQVSLIYSSINQGHLQKQGHVRSYYKAIKMKWYYSRKHELRFLWCVDFTRLKTAILIKRLIPFKFSLPSLFLVYHHFSLALCYPSLSPIVLH